MKIYIYALIDPRTNQIRYVGKTNNLKNRYRTHLQAKNNNNNKKDEWINNLIDELLFPEIFVLDIVNEIDWEFWEQHYISLYESFGYDLFNITTGGKDIIYRNKNKENKIEQKTIDKIIENRKNNELKRQQYNMNYYNFIKSILKPYKEKIQLDINLCIQLEILYNNRNNDKAKIVINKEKYNLINRFIKYHYNTKIETLYNKHKINFKTL